MTSEPDVLHRKAMVFDVDKSLSTLGSLERQTEIFGVEPLELIGGIDTLNTYLDNLLQVKQKDKVHPLLGATGKEVSIDFNEEALEMGLNTLMIDSLTVLGMQERNALKKKHELVTMELQTWGEYGDKMVKFINKLSKAEFAVVCTAHVSRDKDENGAPIEIPGLKGASALECGRFFDVIAYCSVSRDASGSQSRFSWIISSDRRHIMAKNRHGVLGTQPIRQDLSLIFARYAMIEKYDPKILILGDSGQGKSWSLQTLNSYEPSQEMAEQIQTFNQPQE